MHRRTPHLHVQDEFSEPFKTNVLARMGRARVGAPDDPETEVRPLVSEAQFQEITVAIERGEQEGGTLAAGGECPDPESYLVTPALFA
jgi:betaine-aldehyde dehydrogenase